MVLLLGCRTERPSSRIWRCWLPGRLPESGARLGGQLPDLLSVLDGGLIGCERWAGLELVCAMGQRLMDVRREGRARPRARSAGPTSRPTSVALLRPIQRRVRIWMSGRRPSHRRTFRSQGRGRFANWSSGAPTRNSAASWICASFATSLQAALTTDGTSTAADDICALAAAISSKRAVASPVHCTRSIARVLAVVGAMAGAAVTAVAGDVSSFWSPPPQAEPITARLRMTAEAIDAERRFCDKTPVSLRHVRCERWATDGP